MGENYLQGSCSQKQQLRPSWPCAMHKSMHAMRNSFNTQTNNFSNVVRETWLIVTHPRNQVLLLFQGIPLEENV